MYLPQSVTFSKRVTDQFRTIKSKTGINNNVLARIAIMLAIESNSDVRQVAREDAAGQSLDRDLLFGDAISVYEVVIREYMFVNKIDLPIGGVISSLVEMGCHKMGHVRSLEQLVSLA